MPNFLQNTQTTQPTITATTFTSADTTVAKAITAAINGPWHLFELLITSDDTAAAVVDVFTRTGSTNSLLGSVSVPAGSGKNGVAPVSFIAFIAPATLTGMDFQTTVSIQAAVEATLTVAKTLTITAFYATY